MKKRPYRLKDYLVHCRTFKVNGTMQVMPAEIRSRYALSIDSAENCLWETDSDKQPKIANFFGYLIEQCEMARGYTFPEVKLRKRDELALDQTQKVVKFAGGLAKILKNYPHAYAWPVSHSILDTGVHLRTIEDDAFDTTKLIEIEGYGFFPDTEAKIPMGAVGGGPAYSIRLAELLESFSRAVSEGGISAQKGPFLHRFRHGPLYFPGTKEGKQAEPPNPHTCLAVLLAFRISEFTSIETTRPQGCGTPIKLNSSPLWPLVEELTNDALGHRIDSKIVQQLLRRNADIEVWGYE